MVQSVKELSLLHKHSFLIVLSIMFHSLVKKMYLFFQMSETSLDQGKALTYSEQAGLCNISSSSIKGDMLID